MTMLRQHCLLSTACLHFRTARGHLSNNADADMGGYVRNVPCLALKKRLREHLILALSPLPFLQGKLLASWQPPVSLI
jgi:hypothetical protein